MADEQEKPNPLLKYLVDNPVTRLVRDTGVDVARGVVGFGEGMVGLADIAQRVPGMTGIPVGGETAGGALSRLGWDPALTDKLISEGYSPERQAKRAEAEKAKGFVESAKAYLSEPELIAGKVAESSPLMVGAAGLGGLAGRFLPGLLGGAARATARGAIGEGALTAGSIAEGVRQETGDLTPQQALLASAGGAATGLISGASGAVARKFGLDDLDTVLAGGARQGGARALGARVAGGVATEGGEEMLQSGQEQAIQNLALGKPVGEGVPESMAVGGLTGGAMGGAMGALPRGRPQVSSEDRAAEVAARAERAVKSGKPVPEIGGVFETAQVPDEQSVPPAPSALETARRNAELAQFAQQGPLSTAAAFAIGSGLSEQSAARRMEEDVGGNPLAMPEPATEDGKARNQHLAATLAQSPSMSLQQAQSAIQKAADKDVKVTVVPHPFGGYTVAPTSFLGADAVEKFAKLQEMPVELEADRKQMPIATREAAKSRADRLTLETGVEHEVAPHPLSSTKFTVRAKPEEIARFEEMAADPVTASARERARLRKSLLREQELQGREDAWQKSQAYLMERRRQNTAKWEAIEAEEAGGLGQPAPTATAPEQMSIDSAAHQAAASLENDLPQPSTAQIKADNYKMGTLTSKEDPRLKGLTIKIETPKGAPRAALDGSWANVAPNHYGRIKGTKGADGEPLDVHVGNGKNVYVVSQNKPDGSFDEHKVMMFFDSAQEAEAAYKAAYPPGWNGLGSIEEVGDVEDLKKWIGAREADLSQGALDGLSIDVDVEVEETGERLKVRQDAKEALIEARTKVRSFEQVARCLKT